MIRVSRPLPSSLTQALERQERTGVRFERKRVYGRLPAERTTRMTLKPRRSCRTGARTPSRASISARRRGIVQLRRSATGCSNKGVTTRNAASLFTAICCADVLKIVHDLDRRDVSLRILEPPIDTGGSDAGRRVHEPSARGSAERSACMRVSAENSPCFSALLLPLVAPPAAPVHPIDAIDPNGRCSAL